MTTIYIIWALIVVPAFTLMAHYSFKWAQEDLEVITNNDKLGIYAISGLLALGWPIIASIMIVKAISNYIDGPNG
jgi:TRAP-type C4-dicarboxylate transport system permease small subunit